MKIKLEFDSDRPEEMETLQAVLAVLPIGADHPQTVAHGYTSEPQPEQQQAATQSAATGPSVEQLIAGMTLKPTESSTIDGGHKISKGDYVVFNDEDWLVEATYRGTIVASNEAGKADVIKTSDCTKSDIQSAPATPRAGTAAALLNNEQQTQQPAADQAAPTGPVSNEKAQALREIATNKVSGGKVDVNEVFNKLGEFNVQTIDQLSAANAVLFEQWLNMAGEEPPAGDGKFGF